MKRATKPVQTIIEYKTLRLNLLDDYNFLVYDIKDEEYLKEGMSISDITFHSTLNKALDKLYYRINPKNCKDVGELFSSFNYIPELVTDEIIAEVLLVFNKEFNIKAKRKPRVSKAKVEKVEVVAPVKTVRKKRVVKVIEKVIEEPKDVLSLF